MTTQEIKTKLIQTGIKNLKEFGYPEVNEETILSDELYSAFFLNMLRYNKGNGKNIDVAIDELIAEIV